VPSWLEHAPSTRVIALRTTPAHQNEEHRAMHEREAKRHDATAELQDDAAARQRLHAEHERAAGASAPKP
jgi:hypothetical protein